MSELWQNGAVFLWAALAVFVFISGRRQGAAAYLLTAFFVFMAVWYGLRSFGGLPVFDGIYGWIFRGVILVFLAAIVFVWYKGRNSGADGGEK